MLPGWELCHVAPAQPLSSSHSPVMVGGTAARSGPSYVESRLPAILTRYQVQVVPVCATAWHGTDGTDQCGRMRSIAGRRYSVRTVARRKGIPALLLSYVEGPLLLLLLLL